LAYPFQLAAGRFQEAIVVGWSMLEQNNQTPKAKRTFAESNPKSTGPAPRIKHRIEQQATGEDD
jgi:hypothetical protein